MIFAIFGLGPLELAVVFGVVLLAAWPLVDCLCNEPSDGNDKFTWVLVIIFLGPIGGLMYILIRRPQRIAMKRQQLKQSQGDEDAKRYPLEAIANNTQWYMARHQEKFGPYTFAQLTEFAATGRVLQSDMLLQVGTQKWVEAKHVLWATQQSRHVQE